MLVHLNGMKIAVRRLEGKKKKGNTWQDTSESMARVSADDYLLRCPRAYIYMSPDGCITLSNKQIFLFFCLYAAFCVHVAVCKCSV